MDLVMPPEKEVPAPQPRDELEPEHEEGAAGPEVVSLLSDEGGKNCVAHSWSKWLTPEQKRSWVFCHKKATIKWLAFSIILDPFEMPISLVLIFAQNYSLPLQSDLLSRVSIEVQESEPRSITLKLGPIHPSKPHLDLHKVMSLICWRISSLLWLLFWGEHWAGAGESELWTFQHFCAVVAHWLVFCSWSLKFVAGLVSDFCSLLKDFCILYLYL